jgi:hypothetical protein
MIQVEKVPRIHILMTTLILRMYIASCLNENNYYE